MTEIMLAAADGKLPDWIRVLPLGEVNLSDGREPFQVDAEALTQIVAAFRSRGIDMVIDYEHQTLQGERAPAAGWIKELQAREDGLWGRADWTAQASEYLKNREYRYFSPVLRLDPATRRPTALLHLGLTNVPAINHPLPLVAKAEMGQGLVALGDITAERLAQVARSERYGIGIKSGGHDLLCSTASDIPEEHWGDPVNYRFPIPDPDRKAREILQQWQNPEIRGEYSEPEQSIIEQRIKSRAEAVGMTIQEEAQAMKEKVLVLLALKAGATDDEVFKELEGRLKVSAALPEIAVVLALKAEASVSEIIGTIKGLKGNQDRLTVVEVELAALKQAQSLNEADAAVEAAITARKISPAMREIKLKQAQRDLAEFKAEMAVAPVILAADTLKPAKGGGGKDGLDADQLALCATTGIKPEAFKASREQLIEQNLLRGEG